MSGIINQTYMKKTLLLSLGFILILHSCQENNSFKSNKYYKGSDNGKEFYLTFLNDSIAAFNFDDLKHCNWSFIKFNKLKNGLYKTNEHKIDTVWIKESDGNLIMIQSKNETKLDNVDLLKEKVDSLSRQIEIVKGFREKGITYTCGYAMKDIAYFYDKAIQETRKNLKNPKSAKFKGAYIHKYKTFNKEKEYVESEITVTSFDVEAKNGFGNFTEDKYYVFFIPNKPKNSGFEIEFSSSPVLNYKLEKEIFGK